MIAGAQEFECIYGNCHDGFGQLNAKDGRSYVGSFKDGRFEGYGIFNWDISRKYIGYWLNGQLHGIGSLIIGQKEIKGLWFKNRFVSIQSTKNNISHGKNELEKIVQYNPDLKPILDSFTFLSTWIIDQLNGVSIGQPIYWMNQTHSMDTQFQFNAFHIYPNKNQLAQVWVRPCKDPMAFIAFLCFELYNIQSHELFNALDLDVKMFRSTREQYIQQCAYLEFLAAHKTARFYRQYIASYCEKNLLKNKKQWWYVYMPKAFSDWKKTWTSDGYPYIPFGVFYDKMVKGVIKTY